MTPHLTDCDVPPFHVSGDRHAQHCLCIVQRLAKGFTVRDLRLNQTFFLNTGFDISGIAAGPNSDVYLTSANNIYHYKADGTLLQKMTFPDTGIKYIGITATSDRVYATYTGSQVGVTVRDLNLNQLSCFGTAFTASGIAAGDASDLYT